jgi:hypothetical protein
VKKELQKFTDASEEHASAFSAQQFVNASDEATASIFRVAYASALMIEAAGLFGTRLYGVTPQKTVIFLATTVKSKNPRLIDLPSSSKQCFCIPFPPPPPGNVVMGNCFFFILKSCGVARVAEQF